MAEEKAYHAPVILTGGDAAAVAAGDDDTASDSDTEELSNRKRRPTPSSMKESVRKRVSFGWGDEHVAEVAKYIKANRTADATFDEQLAILAVYAYKRNEWAKNKAKSGRSGSQQYDKIVAQMVMRSHGMVTKIAKNWRHHRAVVVGNMRGNNMAKETRIPKTKAVISARKMMLPKAEFAGGIQYQLEKKL